VPRLFASGPTTALPHRDQKRTHTMRRLLPFVKPHRRDSILALLLVVLITAIELTIPGLVQRIIDFGIAERNISIVRQTTLLMLGAGLVSALLTVGNTFFAVRVTSHVSAELRSALFRKIQSFSFSNLDQFHTGALMVRLTSDVNQLGFLLLMSLRVFTRAPLRLLGSFVLMFLTNRQLASVIFLLLPATTATVFLITTRGWPLFGQAQRRLDRLNTVLQENLAGVRVVKAFVRANHEKARFEAASTDFMQDTVQAMRLFSLLVPTLYLFVNCAMAAVVWFGGPRVVGGSMTEGQLVAFVNYLLAMQFPLFLLGTMATVYSAAQASSGRILEILDTAPGIQNQHGARTLPHVKGRVAFEDVSFSYSQQSDVPVLNGVNLIAEPGETVAILGATGSGKSSLVHLIPRFYDPTAGRVTIDGIDVRDVTVQSLRQQLGVALQHTVLLSGTIRDNIRYGQPDAEDEQVVAAAKAAQAHDFVMDFPAEYDTEIGQRGVRLSGGQRQRIAIARALLVKPRILILDDATSSVDAETEAKIEAAVQRWMVSGTTFIVAQRVSTVLRADRIVVLERGSVVAVGTHPQLLASSSVYREIYESQLGSGGAADG